MATNDEVATSLRTLAEAADDEIAQHDLIALADALEGLGETKDYPTTREELLAAVEERMDDNVAHWAKYQDHAPHQTPDVYVGDHRREEFLDEFPNWKLVDRNGRNERGLWWNYPVLRDE